MTNESGADYIVRMARGSRLMGEKGRIAWTTLAGLVTADDLREAVESGAVRVEKVSAHGRTVTHIVMDEGGKA